MTEDELDTIEEMVAFCGERSLRYLADEIHGARELKKALDRCRAERKDKNKVEILKAIELLKCKYKESEGKE